MRVHALPFGNIHEGDWLTADLEPGYTLAILDGPYGMGKAAWDRMGVEGLAEWYAPHLARVSALLAPSASMYVWNTAEGNKRLDPVIRALGWTWRADIVWDKVINPAVLGWRGMTRWGDQTEVCGVYGRGLPHFEPTAECVNNVWRFDVSNDLRKERIYEGTAPDRNGLWESRASLHPCQKPLLFAERMILASTRPGERVLVPFGGTCREAVVCEWLARTQPEAARRYDVCELNQDPGRDYIGAALAQIRGEDPRPRAEGQVSLFGAR